ncbi:MAG: alanine racemase [Clostridia bacterium]|nr:alanine racemase [Clostridia bacterium]NCC43637.1 alanine racemase [Clostridia bacterium]
MTKKHDRVYAAINLKAIEENFENMRKNLTPGTRMIAVVKADAYGHGAVKIASMMQEKDYIWGFAVATSEEAYELRTNGIDKPILILGFAFPEDYRELVKEEIRPAVFSLKMAMELSEAARKENKVLPIHLAVDTGMTRIGFRNPKESLEEIVHISKLPNLKIEGMFTHFARADESNLEYAREQFRTYNEFLQLLLEHGINIPVRHCNNSAGILWHREGDMDAVRPGITIYGVAPSDEVVNPGVILRPAMELKSHVSYVKDVEAGVGVSYGGTYVTVREKTKIATIPVGYADGYPRGLSNKGYVLIHGKKANILGRVCMDQFMVDVTDIPGVECMDEVTLLGHDQDAVISIEELSALSGRFPYEFLCCISKRVPRVYDRQ